MAYAASPGQRRSKKPISYPRICKFYNSAAGCKHGEDGLGCTALHVCVHFVKGDCSFGTRCRRSHDIYNRQCSSLLQRSGVDVTRSNVVILLRQALQDDDAGNSRRKTLSRACSVGHLSMPSISLMNLSEGDDSIRSEDDPPEICMYNLKRSGCLFKTRCHNLHCEKPFQWQTAKNRSHAWVKLDDKSNMRIELSYSDPSNETWKTELPRLITINFDNMIMEMMDNKYKVRRVSTRSWVKMPENQQNLATKWAWFWKNELDQWVEYGKGSDRTDVDSAALERKYLEDRNGTFDFKTTGHSYTIFFKDMIQRNKTFGTQRPIRRRPLPYSDSSSRHPVTNPGIYTVIPKYWDKHNEGNKSVFRRIKIHSAGQTAEEFKKVQDRFEETMPPTQFTIVSIERIQNLELWEGYQWKLNWMMKKTGKGRELFEKLLFHGTKEEYIDAICNQGFDWRLSGTSVGTLYGQGSYFARDAKYSSSYAHGNKMFLVRVLVGDYTFGHKSYRVPPNKPGDTTERYHSCVDNEQNPSIFVIFEHTQCYPEYLITYSMC